MKKIIRKYLAAGTIKAQSSALDIRVDTAWTDFKYNSKQTDKTEHI